MTDYAIRVAGLCKEYVIGRRERTNRTFRETISDAVGAPLRRLRNIGREPPPEERFWALKDVSFDVKPGELVGIIGRNGAGKSTLLKILSRITAPTKGRIKIRGRVASLLEVGTGFHSELTGRENIYLNGAILGMSRVEIRRNFDNIVAFAEVEKFLDTPVKHYSSGMYVRLAFAVAAHLETEIMAIDEVLAVGDAAFQKRCLGKMSDVAAEGRTLLFVSHNLNAVERLCQRVIWLEDGSVSRIDEDVREGIVSYLKACSRHEDVVCLWRQVDGLVKNNYFVPREFRVSSASPCAPTAGPFSNQFDIIVDVFGDVLASDPALNVGIALYSEEGSLLFQSFTTDTDLFELAPGPIHLQVRIPRHFLNEGTYRLELLASLYCRAWLLEAGRTAPMVSFSIQGGLSDSPYWHQKRSGIFAPVLRWMAS